MHTQSTPSPKKRQKADREQFNHFKVRQSTFYALAVNTSLSEFPAVLPSLLTLATQIAQLFLLILLNLAPILAQLFFLILLNLITQPSQNRLTLPAQLFNYHMPG